MTMLIGWINDAVEAGAIPAVLERMAPGAEPRHIQAGPGLVLAVAGREDQCDIAAERDLAAAIVGRARWTQPELASVAAQAGQAAAVIEAYRRYGDDFLQHLRGSFSLALIAGKRLVLAIDRLGVGRLCYSRPKSGGLVFATSVDAVRAHPAVESTISAQALFNYLYFAVCPSPGTIYQEQFKLLPAQYLVHEAEKQRTAFYWRMPYREANNRTVAALAQETLARLGEAVRRGIGTADAGAVGAFLSGGLDSSTVAGLLSKARPGSAKTFTIGFANAGYDETGYADIAARHFRTEHHAYYLTPEDVVQVLPTLSAACDEPFGNSSVVPTYYCARMAQEHGVRLMLAGDGGDEIFAGNSRYVDQEVFGLYERVPAWLRRLAIEPVAFGLPGLASVRLGRRMRNYIDRAKLPMPDRMETYNFYRNAVLPDVLDATVLASIDPEAPLANLREAYDRTTSGSMVQRMMHLDLKITLADNDLRKVETACEMAGVDVAYPFLDDDMVELSAQIPPTWLIRRLERRWFFKQAVKDFLPPETLAKRKHGFGMPFAEWPREHAALRDLAADALRRFKSRHYLRPDFLDRMLAPDAGGTYDVLVWDIMMLELWLRERETGRHALTSLKIVA